MQHLKLSVCLIQEVIASIGKLGHTGPQPKLGLIEFLRLLALKPWKVAYTCSVFKINRSVLFQHIRCVTGDVMVGAALSSVC